MALGFGLIRGMSIQAPPVKTDRALIERLRRARRDEGLALLEGLHALKHALRFDAEIEAAWTDDRKKLLHLADALAPDIVERLDDLVQTVSSGLFQDLAPRAPKTGVIALARRPLADPERLLAEPSASPMIWLEDPAHLGNIGAVVRVAAAAGASAVLTSGPIDPWDPAALRGSAGLHFALPVLRLEPFAITRRQPGHPQSEPPMQTYPMGSNNLLNGKRPLIAIDPEGDPLKAGLLPANALLAFGSERQGLSPGLLDQADQCLSLPMSPKVSSLNLATAVAAVLYAWKLVVVV